MNILVENQSKFLSILFFFFFFFFESILISLFLSIFFIVPLTAFLILSLLDGPIRLGKSLVHMHLSGKQRSPEKDMNGAIVCH